MRGDLTPQTRHARAPTRTSSGSRRTAAPAERRHPTNDAENHQGRHHHHAQRRGRFAGDEIHDGVLREEPSGHADSVSARSHAPAGRCRIALAVLAHALEAHAFRRADRCANRLVDVPITEATRADTQANHPSTECCDQEKPKDNLKESDPRLHRDVVLCEGLRRKR